MNSDIVSSDTFIWTAVAHRPSISSRAAPVRRGHSIMGTRTRIAFINFVLLWLAAAAVIIIAGIRE